MGNPSNAVLKRKKSYEKLQCHSCFSAKISFECTSREGKIQSQAKLEIGREAAREALNIYIIEIAMKMSSKESTSALQPQTRAINFRQKM